jgi:hypothetical protein
MEVVADDLHVEPAFWFYRDPSLAGTMRYTY